MTHETEGMNRRTFVKQVAAAGGGLAAAPALAAADSSPDAATARPEAAKEIHHVLLFMHPPVTYSQHKLLRPAPEIAANWHTILEAKGGDTTAAVCIIQSGNGDKPLVEAARRHFGDRCIVDPSDSSDPTLVLMAQDMNRAFSKRGNHGEWNIYELWSSNNARRWVEGFKQDLAKRGYRYTPKTLSMETFGSWSGCHHKYSNFMAVYLGMTQPAALHGETNLCTLKGLPMDAREVVECLPLERHVVLTLFRRTDGCPMAQFWDGLRPVWEPPHTATVTIDPGAVDLFSFSPNSLIPVNGVGRKLKNGFLADVGDGCHPAFTTVVGRGAKDADFETFRNAMANAVIAPREAPGEVFYAVEV